MSDESLRDVFHEEKEEPILDYLHETAIEAFSLIVGGVVGGLAFQVVIADLSREREIVIYLALFGIAVAMLMIVKVTPDIIQAVGRYVRSRL